MNPGDAKAPWVTHYHVWAAVFGRETGSFSGRAPMFIFSFKPRVCKPKAPWVAQHQVWAAVFPAEKPLEAVAPIVFVFEVELAGLPRSQPSTAI